MLGKSYLVVANQNQAKILLEKDGASSLELVTTLSNDDGRASDSDLVTDRPGATHSPSGAVQGVDSMSRKDAAETEAERFAHTVAEWLDDRRCSEKVNHIDIIAEPGFLGKLRNNFNKQLEKLVGYTVNKDVVKADEARWLEDIRSAGRGSKVV